MSSFAFAVSNYDILHTVTYIGNQKSIYNMRSVAFINKNVVIKMLEINELLSVFSQLINLMTASLSHLQTKIYTTIVRYFILQYYEGMLMAIECIFQKRWHAINACLSTSTLQRNLYLQKNYLKQLQVLSHSFHLIFA